MKRIIGIFLLFIFASADAALIDRGGGFIYDDVLDITWAQDANINGVDTWDNQVAWAAGLSIVDTRPGAGGVTYSDWRLPSMDVNSDGTVVNCSTAGVTELACRDNEYAYLFFQNGVTTGSPGFFTNIQPIINYWSGTEFAPSSTSAWAFRFFDGGQAQPLKRLEYFAWAVRPGDVSVVPVPAAVWLFASALGLLGWMRRKAG